ncbi:MAG TPA: hypothetical protein VMR28_03060 [Candidatus Saccharimonadales bacterium]|nr:hypothetical protein [Candidatus Saccharimonadales bacterium]
MVSPHHDPDGTKDISKDISIEALHKLIRQRNSVFKRFPLVFALLATFGLVATFYGFQHILQKVPLLANDPYITLIVGVGILLLTGTLYKKLG